MITRRFLLQAAAAGDAYSSGLRATRAENAPGVRSARPRPTAAASAYGVLGRTQAAYFKMINEQGGVNGRKLNLMSFDEGYSPPKTVEQTRRLVEQEGVAFIFGSLGTPTNAAIRSYLNENEVPQRLIQTTEGGGN
jgi:branched-chain amino acid transport system substrate-binding protein